MLNYSPNINSAITVFPEDNYISIQSNIDPNDTAGTINFALIAKANVAMKSRNHNNLPVYSVDPPIFSVMLGFTENSNNSDQRPAWWLNILNAIQMNNKRAFKNIRFCYINYTDADNARNRWAITDLSPAIYKKWRNHNIHVSGHGIAAGHAIEVCSPNKNGKPYIWADNINAALAVMQGGLHSDDMFQIPTQLYNRHTHLAILACCFAYSGSSGLMNALTQITADPHNPHNTLKNYNAVIAPMDNVFDKKPDGYLLEAEYMRHLYSHFDANTPLKVSLVAAQKTWRSQCEASRIAKDDPGICEYEAEMRNGTNPKTHKPKKYLYCPYRYWGWDTMKLKTFINDQSFLYVDTENVPTN